MRNVCNIYKHDITNCLWILKTAGGTVFQATYCNTKVSVWAFINTTEVQKEQTQLSILGPYLKDSPGKSKLSSKHLPGS